MVALFTEPSAATVTFTTAVTGPLAVFQKSRGMTGCTVFVTAARLKGHLLVDKGTGGAACANRNGNTTAKVMLQY
jgi:hypothetical protein